MTEKEPTPFGQKVEKVTEKEPTPFSHFPQRGSPCHGSAVAVHP